MEIVLMLAVFVTAWTALYIPPVMRRHRAVVADRRWIEEVRREDHHR